MFRLKNFYVKHKNEVLYDCDFLNDSSNLELDAYTSLVLGENGSGKSYLLSLIADFVREYQNWISNGVHPSFSKYEVMKVTYILDGNVYELKNDQSGKDFLVNGMIAHKEELRFPNKILAMSFIVNDKFSYYSGGGSYEYMGVREAQNATYVDSVEKKIVTSIKEIFQDDRRIREFPAILKFAGFSPQFTFSYKLNVSKDKLRKIKPKSIINRMESLYRKDNSHSKHLSTSHIYPSSSKSSMDFKESRSNVIMKNRTSQYPNVSDSKEQDSITDQLKYIFLKTKLTDSDGPSEDGLSRYGNAYTNEQLKNTTVKYDRDFIQRVCEFVRIAGEVEYSEDKGIRFHFDLALEFVGSHFYTENVEIISFLEWLGYISKPKVELYKKEVLDFNTASSGEQNIIFTLLGLLAKGDVNSLVLIDEPELSLHPSWQMRYVSIINKICSLFPGCHCLMATHSHFMVSDLDPSNSSLIIVEKDKDSGVSRKCELVPYSTYAWSAENILYKIFGLRTTRNHYFEMEVTELLQLVSNRSDKLSDIKRLYKSLSSLVMDKHDPLVEVLAGVKKIFG